MSAEALRASIYCPPTQPFHESAPAHKVVRDGRSLRQGGTEKHVSATTPCCSLRLIWSGEAVDQDALFGKLLTNCAEFTFESGLLNKRRTHLTQCFLALLQLTKQAGALLLQFLDLCIAILHGGANPSKLGLVFSYLLVGSRKLCALCIGCALKPSDDLFSFAELSVGCLKLLLQVASELRCLLIGDRKRGCPELLDKAVALAENGFRHSNPWCRRDAFGFPRVQKALNRRVTAAANVAWTAIIEGSSPPATSASASAKTTSWVATAFAIVILSSI